MADIKIGAYVCKGCGIDERLDVKQLVSTAKRDGKAAVAKDHEFLCNADGVAMIQNDITNDGVNHNSPERSSAISTDPNQFQRRQALSWLWTK